MDSIVQITVQFVLFVLLAGYFALIALMVAGVLWVGFHMLRDHWTLAQTWHQAKVRLFH